MRRIKKYAHYLICIAAFAYATSTYTALSMGQFNTLKKEFDIIMADSAKSGTFTQSQQVRAQNIINQVRKSPSYRGYARGMQGQLDKKTITQTQQELKQSQDARAADTQELSQLKTQLEQQQRELQTTSREAATAQTMTEWNKQWKEDYDKLKEENNRLTETIDAQQESLDRQKQELQGKDTTIRERDEQIALYTRRLSNQDLVQVELAELKKSESKLTQQLEDAKNTKISLERELEAARASAKTNQEKDAQISQLEQEKNRIQERLEATTQAKDAEIERLRKKVQEAPKLSEDKDYLALRLNLKHHEQQLESAQKDLVKKEDQIKQLEQEKIRFQGQLAAAKEEGSKEIESLRTQIQQSKQELSEQKDENTSTQITNRDLQRRLETAEQSFGERLANATAQAQEECKQKGIQVTQLEEEKAKAQELLATAKEESRKEIESLRAQLQQSKQELSEQKDENTNTQIINRDLQRRLDTAEQSFSERLANATAQAQEESKQKEIKITQLEKENDAVQKQLSATQQEKDSEIKALRAQVQKAQDALTEEKDETLSMQLTNKSLEKDLESAQKSFDERLAEATAKAREECTQKGIQVTQLEEEKAQVQEQLTAAKQEKDREVAQLREELQSIKQKLEQEQDDSLNMKLTYKHLEANLKSTEERNRSLTEQLIDATAQTKDHEQKNILIAQLEDEKSKVQEQLTAIEKEKEELNLQLIEAKKAAQEQPGPQEELKQLQIMINRIKAAANIPHTLTKPCKDDNLDSPGEDWKKDYLDPILQGTVKEGTGTGGWFGGPEKDYYKKQLIEAGKKIGLNSSDMGIDIQEKAESK